MEQSNPPASVPQQCIHQVRLFFIALQFFTRLPIPRWVGFAPEWLHSAARYFPAVGILVGAVTGGSCLLLAQVFPMVLAVLLSTALGVWLTGAFHEDGFADMCDGFGGGYTKERTLEIMKDSRIGAYGAIGISLLLATKCATLSFLAPWHAAAALLAAHPASRLSATAFIWCMDYVKEEGKAKPLAQHISGFEFFIAMVMGLLPIVLIGLMGQLSWAALAAGLAMMLVLGAWLARMFMQRIGGYTGDCLGAVQQVTEAAFYLGVLAVLNR